MQALPMNAHTHRLLYHLSQNFKIDLSQLSMIAKITLDYLCISKQNLEKKKS